MRAAFPPAGGSRIGWGDVPGNVRSAVERALGSSVAAAASQPGGFSPGAAARLRLADGRRVFVKAVGAGLNPDAPQMHGIEARVAAALPPELPTPRLLHTVDDADWVALVFEDVEGRQPRLPWRTAELEQVLGFLAGLAPALTPSPVALPSVGEKHGEDWSGFRDLALSGEPLGDLDPWITANLDRLGELEASWPDAAAGDTLCHVDVRADNLLLTDDGVVLVDWPHAAVGAAWIDLLVMLPSVAMQGGPPPESIFDGHPVVLGADPCAVTAVLCALTGMFLGNGRLPDPPGLPTLRAFQLGQGAHALRWLRRRLGA
jgi:aminoglycoside phosphotransferase